MDFSGVEGALGGFLNVGGGVETRTADFQVNDVYTPGHHFHGLLVHSKAFF